MGGFRLKKLSINPKKLYEGCMYAAIVHAVTVGQYPELNYEHSWDGYNYSMNNSQGCRATITFHPEYIIAVFQERTNIDINRSAYDYLTDMPDDILKIAESEALAYVLQNVSGETRPIITAAFWGTWDELSSNQSWENILQSGGFILENQLLNHEQSLQSWTDYYELNNDEIKLIESLFERKMKNGDSRIYLSAEEAKILSGDIGECKESLRELNIFLPDD